jgi:glutathione S-transferase
VSTCYSRSENQSGRKISYKALPLTPSFSTFLHGSAIFREKGTLGCMRQSAALQLKENSVRVYGDIQSGNCYKIKLLASLLDIEHEWVHIDILNGETRTAEFVEKNPNAKIPVLELEDGRYISESNAILNYLATDTELLSSNPYEYGKIQQWQFFEQYSHEPYIAVARFIAKYLGLPDDRRAEFESKQEGGHKALYVMEQQLQQTPYLTGERLSTADISLYGYTHVAGEGGFDLGRYPAITQWINRIQSQPKYVSMD